MSKPTVLKNEIVAYARKMVLHGFVAGRAGNLSCRIEGRDAAAITPSRMDYDALTAEEICTVDFDLVPHDDTCKPSVESGLHVAVYRCRPEVNAVIHTHQTFAAVLSLVGCSIPPLFDEQIFYLGASVEVIPYAPSGSEELVQNVKSYLSNGCYAYIMGNHGALCLGRTLKEAFHNVQLLEKIAQAYFYARLSNEQVESLPPEAVRDFLQMQKDQQEKR